MKSEDLYNAVTELRDDQVLEGEKRLAGGRPARLRRLGALAAVLAVAVLAGVLAGPRLMAGLSGKPVGQPVIPGTTQAGPTGAAPSDPEAPTEESRTDWVHESESPPDGSGGARPLKYTLAAASYPKMAPYPALLDEFKTGNYNKDAYDKAMKAWSDDHKALRPEGEYADGLDVCLQRLIPALLEGAEGENRAASPLNVYMALAMLAETSAGESRQELLSLLNAPDIQKLRSRANAIWRTCYNDDGLCTSLPGASLWLRDDRSYRSDTVKTLASDYYASVYSGPMGSAEYTASLRDWMNAQTGDLLKEQVDRLELDRETVMALVTTLYFKAAWDFEFTETENGTFHGAAGDREAVFMQEKGEGKACWFGEKFTAARKNLLGGGTMYFLLPREGVSPESLLKEEEVLRFLSDFAGRDSVENRIVKLDLSVPKFDVSAQLRLTEPLKALGVEAIFDRERADFSPLAETGTEGIYVTDASHSARVMIDEKGVTGAAITEFFAGAGMPPEERVELILDRPFLFVVTNGEGLPLFVGIVNEP